jgi:hypothetical protein
MNLDTVSARNGLGIVVEGGLGTTLDGDRWAQASPKAMNIRYESVYVYSSTPWGEANTTINSTIYNRMDHLYLYLYICL